MKFISIASKIFNTIPSKARSHVNDCFLDLAVDFKQEKDLCNFWMIFDDIDQSDDVSACPAAH